MCDHGTIRSRKEGQTLIELLVATAIGAILAIAAVSVIAPALRSSVGLSRGQTAASYARELLENVRIVAEANWNDIALLPSCAPASDTYHLDEAFSPLVPVCGAETREISGVSYSRYFVVTDVRRDVSGGIVVSGGAIDPSTKLAEVHYAYTNAAEKSISEYLFRIQHRTFLQTDWSEGQTIVPEVLSAPNRKFAVAVSVNASTTGSLSALPGGGGGSGNTIDVTDKWAWNEAVGWMDFGSNGTVTVINTKLTGYADSSVGDISLDCATARNGSVCGLSNYSVKNDTVGNLSGWAWNDAIGWISFCGGGGGTDCPLSGTAYRVSIDASGFFRGWAWSDAAGWISFNCADPAPSVCGVSNYKLRTAWRPGSGSAKHLDSAVFDTGITGGAQLDSIVFRGDVPPGTLVNFQVAAGNDPAGPWVFVGEDNTATSFYRPSTTGTPGTFVVKDVDYVHHNSKRYFRYRVYLTMDVTETVSPRIDDIVLIWSP